MSSAVTSTANYRMTICAVRNADHLLGRIFEQADPMRAAVADLTDRARDLAVEMIRRPDWRDMELLIDMIFARGGWTRITALGGGQADVDLVLTQPITGERAWVQVKTRSSQREFDDYLDRFQKEGSCQYFFFVYHTAVTPIASIDQTNVHLWPARQVADAAVRAGLLDWLSDRTLDGPASWVAGPSRGLQAASCFGKEARARSSVTCAKVCPVVSRVGFRPQCSSIRRKVTSQYAGSISTSKPRRPARSAAMMVVPDPRMTPFRREQSRIASSTIATGFAVG